MAAIVDQLMQKLNGDPIRKMSEKIGSNEEQTRSALGSAIPFLLQSMARKSQDGGARDQIRSQIATQKDRGFDLTDITSLFRDSGDSSGLFNQLMGGKQNQVEQYIGRDAGMEQNKVSSLLQMAAPLVTRFLANKEQEEHVDAFENLQRFNHDMERENPKSQGIINKLLDRDDDGDIKDDIADMGKSLFDNFTGNK